LFPSIYTASLVAGERSGNLDSVLRRFVEYTKVIATVRRKTISALVYPGILITLALVLVSIIVLKVVPSFSDFYASFGANLPLVTRVIVAISDFVRGQFLLLVIGIVAVVLLLMAWIRQPGQKARFDRIVLGIPVVGDIAAKFATSQMARTLATLLGGGLPLVHALDIAARSVGNQHIARELEIVSARVREGVSFSSALEARRVFPEVAVKMAEVGESTGALQDMLNTVADFYDEEISTNMERFVTLVEPALLVIMGIVIAGLLLALYMPLFQLSSVLAG
jgi:type IV pilus assembly protein PilC